MISRASLDLMQSGEAVTTAPKRPILWLWGILTTASVFLAYLLALALAVACAVLALKVLHGFSYVNLMVGTGAATCSAVILWSLVPRREQLPVPGAEITRAA